MSDDLREAVKREASERHLGNGGGFYIEGHSCQGKKWFNDGEKEVKSETPPGPEFTTLRNTSHMTVVVLEERIGGITGLIKSGLVFAQGKDGIWGVLKRPTRRKEDQEDLNQRNGKEKDLKSPVERETHATEDAGIPMGLTTYI